MSGRAIRILALTMALQVLAPNAAGAAGAPVAYFMTAAHGVGTFDGKHRYEARPGRHTTIVSETSSLDGTLSHTIRGRFGVPVVAYDGSSGGLSGNGRTLVLMRPRWRFPQRASELAVLDARTLRAVRFVRLRGDFSFDAISPDGEWAYLIQFTPARDLTRYRVRALNTRTGKLLERDIVDPHDRGETMRGYPLARAGSPDGRWVYTLYGGNGQPFVHALDTARLTARCIDVPAFQADYSYAMRLRLTGEHLLIVFDKRALSQVDTKTFSVTALHPERGRKATRARSGSGLVWFAIPAVFVLLAGAVLVLRRRSPGFRAAYSAVAHSGLAAESGILVVVDHVDLATLHEAVDEIRRSPADSGLLKLVVRRPVPRQREVLDEGVLSDRRGLLGDRWSTEPRDPDTMLTLMNARAAAAVGGPIERWAIAGDQLFVDIDLSVENLPPGSRLTVGDALIEITAVPHRGCGKFTAAFGVDAAKFVNSTVGRELNLRGVNARVVSGGVVRAGDAILKLSDRCAEL